MAKVSRALLPGARITAGASRLPWPAMATAAILLSLMQQIVDPALETDLAAQGDDRVRGCG